MAVSSEIREDIFINTIGSNVFEDDDPNDCCENESEDDYVETIFTIVREVIEEQSKIEICLEHKMSTRVDLVGLQVWRGAFLLADFLLHNRMLFKNSSILELASGTGLTAIVAGLCGAKVIATDVDRGDILPLLRRNVDKNLHLYNGAGSSEPPNAMEASCSSQGSVEVAELDFFWPTLPDNLQSKLFSSQTEVVPNPQDNQNLDYILAADVIYDANITQHFFRTLRSLLFASGSSPSRVAYLAIERRERAGQHGQILAPNFQIFLDHLEDLNHQEYEGRSITVTEVPIDFPQYLEYSRVKELTLWKVEASQINKHLS